MNVLIAQSYFRVLDPKELERRMPYPPLGPLIAATMLRNAGHEVVFFDSMIASSLSEFQTTLDRSRADILLLYDDEFNYLSKMCLSNMREAALSMIGKAATKGMRIFVYSSDASDHAMLYLKAGAEAVLTGESEETTLEILEKLKYGAYDQERSLIQGLKFLKDGKIVQTSQRPLQSDLDVFPDPDYNFVNLSAYQAIWREAHGFFSMNVTTTRGCPFRCNWCAKPIYGRTYQVRSPGKVVDHLKSLKSRYGVDHVWMTDDIFGLKPGWITELADELANQGVKIPYKCLTRADLLLREDTIPELRRSGCQTIWIGAESGSQKILDAMDKGTTVSQIYESTTRARQLGMEVAFFIQFGYLGETWTDILMTRKMIRDLRPADIGISVSYPLPGTPFYERVKKQLKNKSNWTDSDDLDLMYDGTYPRTFYKILHRLVHAEYRLGQIIYQKRYHRVAAMLYHAMRFCLFSLRLSLFRRQTPTYT